MQDIGAGLTSERYSPLAQEQSDKLKQIQLAYSGDEKAIQKAQTQPLGERDTLVQGFSDKDLKGNWATYLANQVLKGLGQVGAGIGDFGVQLASTVQPREGLGTPRDRFTQAEPLSKEQEKFRGSVIKSYREETAPTIREYLKEAIGPTVDKRLENKYNGETFIGALGGLASSAPAIGATMVSGGLGTAAMGAQMFDNAIESINSTPEGRNLDEATKTFFAGGVAIAQTALEKYSLDKILKSESGLISNLIAKSALKKAVSATDGKVTGDIFSKFLDKEVLNLSNKFTVGGARALDAALLEYGTEFAQEGASIGGELLVNKSTRKPVFDTENPDTWKGFMSNIKRANKAGVAGFIGGGFLGGFASFANLNKNKIEQNDQIIAEIDNNLQKEGVSDATKELLVQQKIKLQKEQQEYADKIDETYNKLDAKGKEKVNEIAEQKVKLTEAINDPTISPEIKSTLESQSKELDKELAEIKPVEEPKSKEEQSFKDLKEGNIATFEYATEEEIPASLKDKVSSVTEVNGKTTYRVTLPKSQADELLKQEATKQPKLEGNKFTTKEGKELEIQLTEGAKGKVNKIEDLEDKDRFTLRVYDKENKTDPYVGRLSFWKDTDGKFFSNMTFVDPNYRRQGIASAMYEFAKNNGVDIKSSKIQTEEGNVFANKYFNEQKQYVKDESTPAPASERVVKEKQLKPTEDESKITQTRERGEVQEDALIKDKAVEFTTKNGNKFNFNLKDIEVKPNEKLSKTDFDTKDEDHINRFDVKAGNENIGQIELQNQGNNVIASYVEINGEENLNKGIGISTYIKIADYLNGIGKNLRSSDTDYRNEQSEKAWSQLEKQGLAKRVYEPSKATEDYDANPDNYYYVFDNNKLNTKVKEETTDAISKRPTEKDVSRTRETGENITESSSGVRQGEQGIETTKTQDGTKEVQVDAEEKITKAGDPIRAFAEKVRAGKINKLGGFKTSTGFDGAWDLGLETVATALDGGAKVADAIENGLKAIRNTDWYKNLTDKENFDKQYREHLNNEYTVEEETVKSDKKATALKNKDIETKRKELGLEPRETVERIANEDLVKEVKKQISEGFDTENLIDEVLDAKNPKSELKANEVVILKQYQLAKENELLELSDKIVEATEEGKQTTLDKLIEQREAVLNDIDRAYRAGENAGTVTARALQARRIAVLNDYSLANMLIQKRKANGGEKLTTEQVNNATEEYTKIKNLTEEYEKKLKELEKENINLKAEKGFKSIKNQLEFEKRQFGRVLKAEAIEKSIDDTILSLRKKLKKQAGTLSANAIPLDMVPDIAKLAKLYAQKGINSLDGVIDNIFNQLKDDVDGLTKDDIKDIIGSYDYEAEGREEKRLTEFKKRTGKKVEEIRGRLEKGDFVKRKIESIKLDDEGKELKSQLRKIKYDWDKELEKDILARRTKLEKARDIATEVLNLPRALMASVDFSAPLRQGLVLTVTQPKIAGKAFLEMFRQATSQQRFDDWLADLKEKPQYAVMEKAGLYIADPHKAKLAAKEEQFMSNIAEKVPLIGKGFSFNVGNKSFKLGGLNLIGGSERAYVSYLNKLRADVFSKSATLFEDEGKTIDNDPKLYEALATYINSATGRGDLGKLENSAQILNSAFFSPRLIASRVRLLTNWANPVWYANTPPRIRQMYAMDMLKTIGVGVSLLSLAALSGAEVEKDPRSSDFGKIKIGDTRWDMWGGFQQFVRFFAQLGSGQRKNTRDKIIRDINGAGFKGETRMDLIMNMGRSKLAPVPAMTWNLLSGKDMVGQEYGLEDVPKSFIPLFAADLYKAIEREGVTGGLTTGIPAVFGVGVQTYGDNAKKPVTRKERDKLRRERRLKKSAPSNQ